jgi:hypothetical protein
MAMANSVGTIESEMDNLSLQESSSSGMSLVPTNEELFSIGWAKALDPNSGNYYYFILDRKKDCLGQSTESIIGLFHGRIYCRTQIK